MQTGLCEKYFLLSSHVFWVEKLSKFGEDATFIQHFQIIHFI